MLLHVKYMQNFLPTHLMSLMMLQAVLTTGVTAMHSLTNNINRHSQHVQKSPQLDVSFLSDEQPDHLSFKKFKELVQEAVNENVSSWRNLSNEQESIKLNNFTELTEGVTIIHFNRIWLDFLKKNFSMKNITHLRCCVKDF